MNIARVIEWLAAPAAPALRSGQGLGQASECQLGFVTLFSSCHVLLFGFVLLPIVCPAEPWRSSSAQGPPREIPHYVRNDKSGEE